MIKNDNKSNNIKDRAKKTGVVVSDKMDKTVVVKVERLKTHPKYKKKYIVSKRYKAHDEKNEFKEGDKVMLVESKPISKDKKWIAREVKDL
jgi:small subunit ribosomal protein S17